MFFLFYLDIVLHISAGLSLKHFDFNMALRVEKDWVKFFTTAGILEQNSKLYAKNFVKNRVNETVLSSLDRNYLQDLGVDAIGDVMVILAHIKTFRNSGNPENHSQSSAPVVPSSKPRSAKLPELTSEMTHPQFRKFKIDWEVYKTITALPTSQLTSQLYNTCDNATQTSIINTVPKFLTLTEEQLLNVIENLVTKTSNPTVHRMHFANLTQNDNETLKDYLIRLKSTAQDCEFSCPNCQHDLSSSHIRDQFIRGLINETLQIDVLAKASQLQTLEDILKHAEAFETALRDHAQLHDSSEAMAARWSDYKKQKRNTFQKQPRKQQSCTGCGSTEYTSRERAAKCPAWGKVCKNCQIPNHFSRVCRRKEHDNIKAFSDEESAAAFSVFNEKEALVAHVKFDASSGCYTQPSVIKEIDADITPLLRNKNTNHTSTVKIFPDSGADICLASPKHLTQLHLQESDIIPYRKSVRPVGGGSLTCIGWIPVNFKVGQHNTRQPLYICKNIDRIYFSRVGCIDVKILPTSFPFPMDTIEEASIKAATAPPEQQSSLPASLPRDARIPPRPDKLPYPANEENIPKLKQFLIDQFKTTAFNKSTPFPAMVSSPAHIHLKADAKPHVRHKPIPIPYHWKKQVKADLDAGVERGIIAPVDKTSTGQE